MLLSFITCQFTDQSRQNCFPSFTFPFSLILSLLPWLRQPGTVGSVVHHTLLFDMLDALHVVVPVVLKIHYLNLPCLNLPYLNLHLPYLNRPYLNLPYLNLPYLNLPRPRNLIQVPSRLDLPGTVSVVVSHLR
jgi:hypothetical protein